VSIVIERVSVATPEAKELLAELDRILSAAYERDQRHALSSRSSPMCISSSPG